MRKQPIRNRTRHGYTLLELVISSATATLLIGGMASSILVASHALDLSNGTAATRSKNDRAVSRMMRDVRHALRFSELTANAITFTVADRDGDNRPETVRYAWSGVAGEPLTYSYNSTTPISLVDDVQSLDFTTATRTLYAPNSATGDNSASVIFESFTETKVDVDAQTIAINVPPNTAADDLLVVALALDGVPEPFVPPAGWTELVSEGHDGKASLGVWWKIASASEPSSHSFGWTGNETAYGWMMRFTGHDPTSPIDTFSTSTGISANPLTSSVNTSIDNCLMLRIGAFDDGDITVDNSGMADHTTITMDRSNEGSVGTCSGGAAFGTLETAGSSGTRNFGLTSSEEFVTITISIAPDTSP